MRRREFLALPARTAGAGALLTANDAARALPFAGGSLKAGESRRYRVCVIGHTGRGNYGHDWDTAFRGLDTVEIVAVADPDPNGRAKAQARTGAKRAYDDYHGMISREKPDIVVIGPRMLDERLPMFRAAAEAGAHVLMEKPFARDLEEADAMVELADRHRIRVQVGHTARPTPVTRRALEVLRSGQIGQLLEMRGRGKEDRRAGGEDLMVLGTHVFDLMRYFAGDPVWVSAHITWRGQEASRRHARQATESLGWIAGDEIAATFAFDSRVHGYFASRANDVTSGDRFGLTLLGSKGLIFVPLTSVPGQPPDLLLSPSWTGGAWRKIDHPGGEPLVGRDAINRLMALDLIAAIEQNRPPVCSDRAARWTIEMVMGIYASHLQGGARLPLPLRERRHPLAP